MISRKSLKRVGSSIPISPPRFYLLQLCPFKDIMAGQRDFATGLDLGATDLKGKDFDHVEPLELEQWATNISANAAQLSEGHRNYLIKRHGTLDLDPMPDFGDADPYNWPTWKVMEILTHI